MASIIPFLPDGMHLRDSVFEAHEIKAMSAAFDKVCEAMNLQEDSSAKTRLLWKFGSDWLSIGNGTRYRIIFCLGFPQ